jgi:adenylate kinase
VSAGLAVLVIGPPGAGKTAVLETLSTMLQAEGVVHGTLETEQLSMGYPLLEPADWIPQLEAVLTLQREAGRTLFLLTATVESPPELGAVRGALGIEQVLVACLDAPADVLAARLQRREPDSWTGKSALIEKARALAGAVSRFPGVDVPVATDTTSAEEAAARIREVMRHRGWRP